MKLVIFDCDGTLVDSQQAIFGTMQHSFGVLGLPAPERVQVLGVIGLSLPEAFAILAPTESRPCRLRWSRRIARHFRRHA